MRVAPKDAEKVWQLVSDHFSVDASKQKYFCFIINCKKVYQFDTLDGESLTWTNVWPDRTPFIDYKGTSAVLATHVAAVNTALGDLFPA